MPKQNSRVVKLVGLGLAGVGLSHFVKPQLFESITVSAFPRDTRQHIYINGGIETAIGLGLAAPKTRKLAALGTVGYLAYLAGNVARNR
ncbi:hypothetical protein H7J93_24515 [Mycobacterium barrassiae]|uniref:Membrane protein n=1 Tax=Mycolicibacterium moriokaense TaxID=39691 RepID=A0AAD1HHR2_9MYCO|nr:MULTISPECIES: hypothetical protein [Mycobacteriaceae]MCV7042257.1 hypothetical protein [Mycolicibacterium moriokaense]MCV7302794.1 hypothetical protein [Mycobacterium barrassiae]ORB17581.1 hypothetical protein BST36_24555 [Mycolicibacterium moriokaense]BBX05030.1 membrane protein [Mycolicibacterium moriokaense]